jgi:phage gp29-like protein
MVINNKAMKLKDIFRRTPQAVAAPSPSKQGNDIILKIHQEFQDRSRKSIQKWRQSILAAENPDNPRWFQMQDLIDDIVIDAHLSSVISIRKSATLNHRFYVIDKKTGEKLDEQSNFLDQKWFYDFLDAALDAIPRKYTVLQIFREGDGVKLDVIPHRNVCPQQKRVYYEVSGDTYIDYSALPNVIEIIHNSNFGLINDVAPNVIWKRNLMQANAEFSERFGMPLITATTSNKQDVPRIETALKNLGEAGTGVLPTGTEIKVHEMANAGNPEKVYLEPAAFHDNQVSKRFLGSTTITDEGANRNQTQVHIETLDDKIALDDKRLIMFVVSGKLFPILQAFGFPFNSETMGFQFDETEDLTLNEQWAITNEALYHYELDEQDVGKTFNLPITGKKERPTNPLNGFSANFR